MEYLDKIFDALMGGFNFPLMLTINIMTYLVIKTLDYANGKKVLATWEKRISAVLCGFLFSSVSYFNGMDANVCVYTCVMSLISWDVIFKPIIKRIFGGSADYFKED